MNNVIKENENNNNEEKIELFKSRIIEAEKAHPRKSSNLYVFGQEVQMDACQKLWFGGMPSFLHLAVDKATKKVLFGWFEYEEITLKIDPGFRLFLYTDGITEAENIAHQLYGDERLKQELGCMNGKKQSAQLDVEHILNTVHLHADGYTQSDDITMLSFHYK